MKNSLIALLALLPTLALAAPYSFNYQPAGSPWASAGVPGGIPVRTTIYTTITSTGSDQTDAINNALAACPAGQVVYLPSATYVVSGEINFKTRNNITLRGAGMGSTLLRSASAAECGIKIGAGDWPAFTTPTSGNNITAGLTSGSTVLTIPNTSTFIAGQLLKVKLANQTDNNAIKAGAVPVIKPDGGTELRSQAVLLVSKTTTTLTISPALYADYSGTAVKVYNAPTKTSGCGIEDLSIDLTGATTAYGVYLEQCDSCWVKNVKVNNTQNWNMMVLNSVNCEIRKYFSGITKGYGVNNGSGMNIEGSGHCLVVDSIFYKNFPGIEVNFGTSGCVFAYNYCVESTSGTVVGVSFDSNHGAHNSFNLYEGNTGPMFQADGYYGSSSEDTVFRNWFTGVSPGASGPRDPISLKRLARRYQVVGNLFGTAGTSVLLYSEMGSPNIGNMYSIGTAQPSVGRFWADWPNTPGTGGYQEIDLDVQASSTFKGNYNAQTQVIPSAESLGGQTLPASLFLAGKPTWFGSLTWPAYDPSTHNMNAAAIPAGYRYVYGVDVPSSSTIAPSNATISIDVH